MSVHDERPAITICGLGPGAPDLLTERTAKVLERPDPLFLRTGRHPGAERFADRAVSFDAVYDQASSFEEVYTTITQTVAAAAESGGRVTYCVPGSPLVLERSVAQLRKLANVAVEVVPAVSFLDEVWARLGIDPVDDGVRLVDGHRFGVEAAGERGPLLIAHVHAQWVLSDIKLALLEESGTDDDTVMVLQRLGTADERIFEVRVSELDREVEADHLTSLYMASLSSPVAQSLAGSVELMRRLRLECPWDRSQDHASLRRFLVEETYEVLDVLDRIADSGQEQGSQDLFEELESELGDLWLQILFHSRLASEAGYFDVSDVARTLTNKMIGRHPHVFGTENPDLSTRAAVNSATTSSVEDQWEELKAAEQGRSSVLDDIPTAMPSLARASKVIKRVAVEYGLPEAGLWLRHLSSHTAEFESADIGALLLAAVHLARQNRVDAEQALREATNALVTAIVDHEARSDSESADSHLSWVIG